MGAALASCTKHDIEYVNPDVAKYEQVFTERFGTPSSTHTWGFGSGVTRGITRGFYADANEWAATDGGQYIVPDPLTPGQKARVQYYFQMNQYPGGTEDKGQIDFFVQQVYDGGDDPMEGKSPEKYLAADESSYITSGEHMDHLTAGSDNEHINNFNNGTRSTYPNVLDYTDEVQYAKNDNELHHHPDEISLMLNTKTDCFGYANSDASFVRTDRYRQVSAEAIDTWIEQNKSAYLTWFNNNPRFAGEEDAAVNDKWGQRGRSFIGFDFDMIPDDYVFAGDKTWEDGKITAITYSYFSIWLGDNTLVWNGTDYVEASTIGEVVDEGNGKRLYPYMPSTTQKVKMLSANANQYCGTMQPVWGDDKWEIDYRYKDDQGVEQYGGKRIRVDYMIEALRGGYLPDNSSNKKWYRIGGCADGYYSDWIVTFMPANHYTTHIEEDDYDIRVMAEDLSTNENSDFDFNDIVFDVKWITDDKAQIKILAAGGIYPIYVENPNNEAHLLLTGSSANMTMLNTYPGRHYEYTAEPFEVEGNYGRNAANINVYVQKPGQAPQLLTAERGKVASKIGVPTNVPWCDEFQDIEEKWGSNKFAAWVADENAKFWE